MYTTHFLSNDPVKIAEFKTYSNKLNQLKNVSKKTNFCRHFEMCQSNLKATWKLIGTLIKRKTKSQTIPLRITSNTNNEDIADQFNKHFIIIGPNLASKIDKSNENSTQYIWSSSINSFVMENVSEDQVSNLFKNLDANKSSIGIPNKLLKIAAEPLSVPFTQIYNQSIETGIPGSSKYIKSFTGYSSLQKMVMQLTQQTIGLFQLSHLLERFLKSLS